MTQVKKLTDKPILTPVNTQFLVGCYHQHQGIVVQKRDRKLS
ncbi:MULTISPECIES: hypothetical protein [Cyanophyceae]|nr:MULTISPECIES: hypothetical protein [unclassified Trichocoleus]